jgi:hypothetical protein
LLLWREKVKLFQCILFTTYSTWTVLAMNPDLNCERLVTNNLSYGTVNLNHIITFNFILCSNLVSEVWRHLDSLCKQSIVHKKHEVEVAITHFCEYTNAKISLRVEKKDTVYFEQWFIHVWNTKLKEMFILNKCFYFHIIFLIVNNKLKRQLWLTAQFVWKGVPRCTVFWRCFLASLNILWTKQDMNSYSHL